ncbi:MAG: hypothetical protein GY797_25740 [Deltaproteobacteria bacterium]|nr:hypothetical protein [Deltaproteobacteria bacterium]
MIGEFSHPPNIKAMVQIAEFLTKDFSFIKVDLYNVVNTIYFDELTSCLNGVSTKLLTISIDYVFK